MTVFTFAFDLSLLHKIVSRIHKLNYSLNVESRIAWGLIDASEQIEKPASDLNRAHFIRTVVPDATRGAFEKILEELSVTLEDSDYPAIGSFLYKRGARNKGESWFNRMNARRVKQGLPPFSEEEREDIQKDNFEKCLHLWMDSSSTKQQMMLKLATELNPVQGQLSSYGLLSQGDVQAALPTIPLFKY